MQEKVYVYHGVPDDLRGESLIPLNRFEERWPDLHESYVEKYKWRKAIMDWVIPGLNCRWNDVLHFTVVPPWEIRNALQRARQACGLPPLGRSILFFEVPLSLIPAEKAIVYDCKPPSLDEEEYDEEHQAPLGELDPARFHSMDAFDWERGLRIPPYFEEYAAFELRRGRRPLVFNGLPHLLVMDEVCIRGLRMHDWRFGSEPSPSHGTNAESAAK